MTPYCDAFPIAGTSHSSYVPGVWTKKADIDQIILSGAIEVNARRKLPPNFSLPMLPPPIYSTYRDQQGALQSLDASPFSSETLAVPPPYSPRGYMLEMHSVVSLNEEPQRWDACSSSTVFHKFQVTLSLSCVSYHYGHQSSSHFCWWESMFYVHLCSLHLTGRLEKQQRRRFNYCNLSVKWNSSGHIDVYGQCLAFFSLYFFSLSSSNSDCTTNTDPFSSQNCCTTPFYG